jgi:hypothetical protein
MRTRYAAVAALLVLSCGGFLAGRLTMPASTASAASEGGYQYLFLEVGKEYTFHWRDTTERRVVAEVPRAGWVKTKAPSAGVEAPAVWVNLATVEWISGDGKAK